MTDDISLELLTAIVVRTVTFLYDEVNKLPLGLCSKNELLAKATTNLTAQVLYDFAVELCHSAKNLTQINDVHRKLENYYFDHLKQTIDFERDNKYKNILNQVKNHDCNTH